jgi:hypothetical protein
MEEFIVLSKEDLEITEILYKEKKYSNALYHYHQSVEKAVKYVGLSIGGISETQLNTDIKHDPIKVFMNLFKYFSLNSKGLLPAINPHLFTNAKQIIETWSDEDIVNGAWKMIETISNEPKIINEEQYPSHFDALCDHIQKIVPEINLGLENELFKKYAALRLEDEASKTIIVINYGSKILQILLTNTLICSKFKPDELRYPSNKLGNPVDHFNENNSIIRDLPIFIKSMKIVLEFADKINWKKDPISFLLKN